MIVGQAMTPPVQLFPHRPGAADDPEAVADAILAAYERLLVRCGQLEARINEERINAELWASLQTAAIQRLCERVKALEGAT